MKRLAIIIGAMLACNCMQAQDTTYIKEFSIGEQKMALVTTCFVPCNARVLYINLHENENTSVQAANRLLRTNGGTMLRLQHSGERNISFNIGENKFAVDPNRIFTPDGLKASLEKNSTYTIEAANLVQNITNQILSVVDQYPLVIALHNNTDKNFSITDYKRGGSEAINTGLLYINRDMDEDDFILTTDSLIYEQIKRRKINVVLQDNKRAVDDGSLSVYAGKRNRAYINIEAQEGHEAEQFSMLQAVQEIVTSYPKEQQ